MLSRIFLAFLFLLKCKLLTGNNNVISYIRLKYDGSVLRTYRHLESSSRKLKKAQLDHDFLLYCHMSGIMPNFVKFELYKSSLYDTHFYKETTESLLELEINFKVKAIDKLKSKVSSLSKSLSNALSLLDYWYIRSLLDKNISKYAMSTTRVHERKLLNLGIHQPKFTSPNDFIFNYSSYSLSKKEQFLLGLGLDFCLPNFKPKFANFFLGGADPGKFF